MINVFSNFSNEIYLIGENEQMKLFQKRIENVSYFIEYNKNNGFFYVISNIHDEKFKIFRTTKTQTSSEHWIDFLKEKNTFNLIQDFDLFRDHLVIYEKSSFQSNGIKILNLLSNEITPIDLPEFSSIFPGMNMNPESNFLSVCVSSPLQSMKNYKISLKSSEMKEISNSETKNDLNEFYNIETIFVKSKDTLTNIPVTLIYHKFITKDFEYLKIILTLQKSFNLKWIWRLWINFEW
jgi:protease II